MSKRPDESQAAIKHSLAPEPPHDDVPAPVPTLPSGPILIEIDRWLDDVGHPVERPGSIRSLVARISPEPIEMRIAQRCVEDQPSPAPTESAATSREQRAGPPRRFGVGFLHVDGVELTGENGAAPSTGGRLAARIHYRCDCIVKRPTLGVAVHAQDGAHLLGPSTKAHGITIPHLEGTGYIDWVVPQLPLQPGRYLFTAAFFNNSADVVYDYCDRLFQLDVEGAPTMEQGAIATSSLFASPVPTEDQEAGPAGPSSDSTVTGVPRDHNAALASAGRDQE